MRSRHLTSDEEFDLQVKVFREFRRGSDPEAVALHGVCETDPHDVLEVGPGDGLFAERVARATDAHVVAIDISPRMAELTRSRGIDAQVGDVQALPFADASFDCVVANWVLYLADDLDRALREVARVIRPGGRLIASTVAADTFVEIRELLGISDPPTYSFSAESGAAQLDPFFARVERHDIRGMIVFRTWDDLREFVALAPERADPIRQIPPAPGPFATTDHLVVFVADKHVNA